ncbi:hypothetical protein [Leptospira borgpetersenii]|uniref:hypothetical protein n=1 Tax=Leptospira borgpetersenii TaxID=174 RepID=UPI0003473642|nr:hypothetical protein [Leptospira borgpetersenii]UVD75325.1 hypothetical protein LIX27_09655 [Leptospira borgpetersenii]UZW31881.1 hypothetical protein OR565_09655 [Leptospira borgpetersenii]
MIYGFSNGFYRWNTLVGVLTSEVLGQVLKKKTTKKKISKKKGNIFLSKIPSYPPKNPEACNFNIGS